MQDILLSPVALFILFYLGMIAEAIYLIRGRWEVRDFLKLLGAFGFGALGMIPGENENPYDLPFHLFFASVVSALSYASVFRKKLLMRITGRTVLALSVLVLSIIVARWGVSWGAFLAALPSVLAGGVILAHRDRAFGWQVFLYAWFVVLLIMLGAIQFSYAALGVFNGTVDLSQISVLEIFLSGAAFFYVISVAWFLVQLIPIVWKDKQSFFDRLLELRQHLKLLAYGYVHHSRSTELDMLLVCAIVIGYSMNLSYGWESEGVVVAAILVALSVLDGFGSTGTVVTHDGVGAIDEHTTVEDIRVAQYIFDRFDFFNPMIRFPSLSRRVPLVVGYGILVIIVATLTFLLVDMTIL